MFNYVLLFIEEIKTNVIMDILSNADHWTVNQIFQIKH